MEYYNNDYLIHYGVLGMKWGVRRYQNKDGTLTEGGKRRLAKDIASGKSNGERIYEFDVRKNTYKLSRELNETKKFLAANKAYKEAVRLNDEYRKYSNEASRKADRLRWDYTAKIEKKYGKYEDLERNNDIANMKKFSEEMDKCYKQSGVETIYKNIEKKRTAAKDATKQAIRETREYTDELLGKYGQKKLKSAGSPRQKTVSEELMDGMLMNIIVWNFNDLMLEDN